jgi:hypothetical protein
MSGNGESGGESKLDQEKYQIDRAFRERDIAVKEAELELKRQQQQIDSEKWQAEKGLRERELSTKEVELELKRKEIVGSGWRSPLVVAIFAATLAAAGNAVVAIVNGFEQRNLEEEKSEETRILEMIKVDDADKAAGDLGFLLKSGLIVGPSGTNLVVQKPACIANCQNGF